MNYARLNLALLIGAAATIANTSPSDKSLMSKARTEALVPLLDGSCGLGILQFCLELFPDGEAWVFSE